MANLEELKKNSKYLRGTIKDELNNDSDQFDKDTTQILKFHGTYQQDDRDLRQERRKEGLGRAYIMMVRSKIPGGALTAKQYLIHDQVSDELANGSLRITSRQGFQMHGVIKGNLHECIKQINESGITTWGACGDVVRNVMATPFPIEDEVHKDIQKLSVELKDQFAANSHAYSDIWLDGEKITQEEENEPIYGEFYLPRKFKLAIAIPPRNDVDILTNDIGLAAIVKDDNTVDGYNIYVGGGFGMTHGKNETHPSLAQPLLFAKRSDVVNICTKIVEIQRDYGNRINRKQARMKYLIRDKGLEWFKQELLSRLDSSIQTEDIRPVEWTTVADLLGWQEQGNSKLFCCVWVPEGRIKDYDDDGHYKSAFRKIAQEFDFPMRLTANCNVIFYNIDPSQKDAFNQILEEHKILDSASMTEARKVCQACVALPTCGLALGESERVFGGVMDEIDEILRELKLENEPLLVRMTGCPNGCARPYNADISFVGRGPNRYAFFMGGSSAGDRLVGLEKHTVKLDEIGKTVRPYLEQFAKERQNGETFSQYWGRTRTNGNAPHPDQFHEELEARQAQASPGASG